MSSASTGSVDSVEMTRTVLVESSARTAHAGRFRDGVKPLQTVAAVRSVGRISAVIVKVMGNAKPATASGIGVTLADALMLVALTLIVLPGSSASTAPA